MNNKLPQKVISGFPISVFQLMDTGYFDSGFSNVTIRILFDIYSNYGCTAASVAKRLKVHRTHVGRRVSFLEKEEYITRTQSTDDTRMWHIYLTDKGKTYIETHMKTATDEVAKKIAALNEIDKNKLIEAFHTIQTLLNK